MKKLIYLCLCFIVLNARGQNLDLEYQDYVGHSNNEYYFFQYGKRSGLVKPMLVTYRLESNMMFSFLNAKQWKEKGNVIEFKQDSAEIFYDKINTILKFIIGDKEVGFNVSEYSFSDPTVAYFPNDKFLLIAAHAEAPIYKFNFESYELTPLPLTGGNLRVKGDYIFFEAMRYSDNYSDFPEDIYRVHKNDLKNPEKIIIQVEENWYPYSPDVVYARTFPKAGDCATKKCQGAFYNLQSRKYATQEDYIYTEKFFNLNNETYILDIVKNGDEKFFKLKEIMTAPSSFPYEMVSDHSQQPRGNIFKYYNIPLKEKTLPGTFVSHEILYEAPASELRKLSKEQLKILRNTFFAFQGYKFSSGSLTKFFNQFDWYQKMIMGDKSNEDVVIWPDEKKRIALIKEIEESK